ncbi:putative Ig domain-containing protein [Aquimonas sp.]|uniref:putative Ig domain-containing protein n=1 Tax=Aquimonas sp. TaxID=1872588 RepID=UPI0037C14103
MMIARRVLGGFLVGVGLMSSGALLAPAHAAPSESNAPAPSGQLPNFRALSQGFSVAVQPAKNEQPITVVSECPLLPVALPNAALKGLQPGQALPRLQRGSAPENFNWLSWTGSTDTTLFAYGLRPPGDSHTYISPDDLTDRKLDAGDWARVLGSNMNDPLVQTKLDALRYVDGIVPVWSASRDSAGERQVQVARFVWVRLNNFNLSGTPWIEFTYLREASCANRPPVFTSVPPLFASVGRSYRYQATAVDPDADPVSLSRLAAPAALAFDAGTGRLRWTPTAADIGIHPVSLRAADPRGASSQQNYSVRVVQGFCPIYPIVLPSTALVGLSPGALVSQLPRGTGAGNFSWLTWGGSQSAPTLAYSLLPPGDSYSYRNPDVAGDQVLNIRDFAQGATGSMNSAEVRSALDALKTRDIILPVWDTNRGKGGSFDYRVQRFVSVRLRDYLLTGTGWLSFEYKGEANCYNAAPEALPQSLTTPEDVALPVTLQGSDEDGQSLIFGVLTQPAHGRLEGTAPNLTYVPVAGFSGEDSFQFSVSDGIEVSEPARVRIVITPVNDAPVAQPQQLSTPAGVALPITLSGTDPDGDALSFRVVQAPANGSLSGSGAALVYTPRAGFRGADGFNFVANDGQLDSAPGPVRIEVVGGNEPPRIVSTPVTAANEGSAYAYDVDAIDPDGDVLRYRLERGPSGLQIGANSGLLGGTLGGIAPQSLQSAHTACYIEAEQPVNPQPNEALKRLIWRTRAAIQSGSTFVAPEAESWHRRNTCLGCHVQTQAVLGLQASRSKARVDERVAEYLLAEILASQQANGSIRRSHPEHSRNQTAFALWSLSYVPDRARTFQVRARALDYMWSVRQTGTGSVYWTHDHGSGWLSDWDSMSALVALSANRFLADAAQRTQLSPSEQQVVQSFDAAMPAMAEFFLQRNIATENDNLLLAFRMLGLAEVLPHIDDAALQARVRTAIDSVDARLRSRQAQDGGWLRAGVGPRGDALVTAWVGFALDAKQPSIDDPVVRAAIENLLINQREDGTWVTTTGLFSTHFATTSLVMAYLPIALDFLGEGIQLPPEPAADLTVGQLRLTESAGLARVSAEVRNRGLADYRQPIEVRFYEGLDGAPRLLGVRTLASLTQGVTEQVTLELASAALSADVRVEIRLQPGQQECVDNNQFADARLIVVEAADPFNLRDQQRYLLNVNNVNAPPTITSTPPNWLTLGFPYDYQVVVDDPDLGDGHRFELVTAPVGLSLDPFSGRFRYNELELSVGQHPIELRVTDLAGAQARQTFTLTVDRDYQPPRLTSTPPVRAIQGQPYRYQATVSADPRADLQFEVLTGPPGLTVNAGTGEVTWAVPLGFAGQRRQVSLAVVDQFDNYDLQIYMLQGDVPNVAPVITGTPPAVTQIGVGFSLDFNLTDPNILESHTWRGLSLPTGAAINASTGVVQWPAASVAAASPGAEISAYNAQCRAADPQAASLSLVPLQTAGFATSVAQPLVGPLVDRNRNGVLDHRDGVAVVAISQRDTEVTTARIHAFDYETLSRRWSYNARVPDWFVAPAMGDLKGDDQVSILFVDSQARLVALNGEGGLRWVSEVPVGAGSLRHVSISLADLDGDRQAEILVGPSVFDADGRLLWQFPAFSSSQSTPLAIDLNGDGRMEVLHRHQARSHSGQLLWTTPSGGNTTVQYSLFAPITLADGSLGIVASEQTNAGARLSLLRADGSQVWRRDGADAGQAATPVVADFNGDGAQEIFLPSNGLLYGADGQRRWTAGGTAWTQRAFRAAVAGDFDGDGALEILGFNDTGLVVLSGASGAVLANDSTWTDTASYHLVPSLLDVRGDGDARLLAAGAGGLRSYRPLSGRWRTQAQVFHQQAWAADRVTPQLSIPPALAGRAHAPIQLLAPAATTGDAGLLSDLHLLAPSAVPQGAGLQLRSTITNRGTLTSRGFAVEFRRGSPSAPGALLGRVEQGPLAPGANVAITVNDISLDALGREEFFAELATDSAELECETRNNRASARVFEIAVVDYGGLEAQRAWAAGVLETQDSPRFTSAAPTAGIAGEPYRYRAQAASNHIGDSLVYALGTAPAGARIDPISGQIEWRPGWTQTGSFRFTITARSLTGRSGSQTWNVLVAAATAPNTAPVITSSPALQASLGEPWAYLIEARDAEGHALSYALLSGPAGMSFDATVGYARWTPGAAGTASVEVRVTDERGASTTQSFQISVISTPNRAPVFDSAPQGIAYVGELWTYAVQVSDPDGDAVQLRLNAAPSSLQFDPALRALRYTPAAADIGTQFIELEASDGRGGSSVQRIQLPVVQVLPGNRPPNLSGSPAATARVGATYAYQPAATDPDGDSLQFSLTTAPAGARINASSGAMNWTPRAEQLGPQAFVLRVDDGRGGWASQNFSVTVQPSNNAAPVITSLPGTQGKAGREYRYALVATDADGDALSYSLQQAPAGMQISSAGRITWTPAAAGSVPVRVRVQDALAWVEQSWTIEVVAADVQLQAQVTVSPNPAQAGAPITIDVSTSGAAAAITASATLNGQPLPLDPDGSTTINAPSQPGNYTLVVTVSDGYDTVQSSATVSVANAGGSAPPTVSLLSPREPANADLLRVTQRLPVRASVNDDNLRSWRLVLVERGARNGEFIAVANGSNTFTDTAIGTLDPTLLQNGQYALLLQAEDLSGNTVSDSVALSVEGDMKIGHFSISFEDVSVPVAGIPVSVTRTYDTRVRHKRQDFGHGWSLDYQNVRVQESRRPGFGWSLNTYPSGPLGLIPRYCVESALGNVVSIVLGDGRVEKFKVKASPACNQAIPLLDINFVFEPTDGARGRLETIVPVGGRLINGSIADLSDPGLIADPDNYRYIDPQGREYRVDQGFGLREIFEREGGNRVTFDRNGITHSNGFALQFTRDAQDRITRITGPGGIDLSYAYSSEGDLASVEDAEDNLTRFEYQTGHYLRDIIDPRGVRVSRNEYDADGRLVAVIDADGHRVEFSRDINGRVEQRRDRNGRNTVYLYNTRGDVLSETNAAGETVTRTYDDAGNTLSETDALGRTQRWTYDNLGNVLTDTDPLGGVTRSVFGVFNQLQTVTDPLNVVSLRQTYRNTTVQGIPIYPGPLVSLTDATGGATGMGYDPNSGELTSLTDASGAITRYEYDAHGFKTAEVDALGRRTTYVNDAQGRLLEERRSRTRADGSTEALVTRYTLDANGNVVATEHPDGSISTTVYDANGKPTESCDALNRCTLTTYDARGNVARINYPDGTHEASRFDPNGNLVAKTDRGGRTTRHVYDEANRLIEVIHPDATPADDSDNPRSRKAYDDAGQLIADTDENGHTTEYRYDAAGRVVRTLLPPVGGQVAEIVVEYDLAGRKTRETDPLGAVTRYSYDAAGRLLSTEVPAVSGEPNAIVRTEYDAVGRKTVETDASGRTTRFGYDGLGRLIVVVVPNPVTGANPALVNGSSPDAGTLTTRYAFDEVGNKIRQTDAEGRETRWEYDAMGRETARILPGGERETKRYNAAGELIEHTDFRGRVTRYTYDAAGRTQGIDHPSDADHSFVYNAAGERIEAVDERGTSGSQFDARGRLLRQQDADGGVIEYRFDAVGNLLERRSPSQTLAYRYDTRNRLIEVERRVQGEAPALTRYTYDAAGRRSSMEGGDGTRTQYGYDSRHRLRSLVKRSALGALLMSMAYQVDADGLRTQISESDSSGVVRTVQYDYDAVRRLVAERIDHRINLQDRNASWSYDRVGNRLRQSVSEAGAAAEVIDYVYDANDRLQSERGASIADYTYDPAGNLLSHGTPAGITEYVYNDAGRMREARSAGEVNAYVYNADGLRVRHTQTPAGATPEQSTTTWSLQDPNYTYAQEIERWTSTGSGPRQRSAVYSFADDLISQTRYDAAGVPTTSYVQADGFGSTRWLTNAAGVITDAVDYDAFGNEIGRSGTTEVEHLYRGEAFDPNVGFYYLRARWMDPRVGRFTQMDPFWGFSVDPRSLHKYVVNHQDPINRVDPSGMISLGYVIQAGVSVVTSSVARVGSAFATSSALGGAALRTVGVATQRAVASILARTVPRAGVSQDVLLVGQGGRRIIDFWIAVQHRVLALEVKYKLPSQGSAAMARLVGQMRTATTQVVAGEYRVVLFTWQAPTAAQQAAVLTALGPTASNVQMVSGALNLVHYLRNFFVLAV